MSDKNINSDIPQIPELQNMDREAALTMLERLDGVRAYLTSFIQAPSTEEDGETGDTPAPTEPVKSVEVVEPAKPVEVVELAEPKTDATDRSLSTMLENEINNLVDLPVTVEPDVRVDSDNADNSVAPSPTELTIDSSTLYPTITTAEQVVKTLITLRAPHYENEKRAPIDLVAVVDRSFSMEGTPLALVKDTLKFIVTQLGESDRLAVVSYGSDVRRVTELTLMDHSGKQFVETLIDTIRAEGYTNLCGGLVDGVDILRARDPDTRADVCSVLLLTDGEANRGYTDAPDIMRACVNKNFKEGLAAKPEGDVELGCTINTFGFSERHKSTVMKQIAEHGRGMFYYIPDAESIGSSFSDCLGGLLSTTSQNLEVTLSPTSDVQIQKVYSKFEVEETPDSRIVKIPDMQSEERREILVDLLVPNSDVRDQGILTIDLSYLDVIADTDRTATQSVTIGRADTVDNVEPDLTVDRANNREIATSAIEEAQALGASNETSTAKVVLTSAIEAIGRSPSAGDAFCLALIEELRSIKDELSNRGYSASLECSMATTTNAHGYQRSTGTNSGAQAAYTTTTRTILADRCTTYMAAPSSTK
jgi:Mg-chelatase subunit ChlD